MERSIAFITGGNRGLGYQTAVELMRLGVHTVIGVRDQQQGEAALENLQREGAHADFLVFDVTRKADHQSAYEHFSAKYGRLDILINNAGISNTAFPPPRNSATTTAVEESSLRSVFETNFFSVVALTEVLLPLIKASPAGRIVNLSSILASLTLHADPKSGVYHSKSFAYDASKTALNAFTIHLAYELRHIPIKVNSAHPGWVKTEMGGPKATMALVEGAKTSVMLATLPADGPSGGFFHMGQPLPW